MTKAGARPDFSFATSATTFRFNFTIFDRPQPRAGMAAKTIAFGYPHTVDSPAKTLTLQMATESAFAGKRPRQHLEKAL